MELDCHGVFGFFPAGGDGSGVRRGGDAGAGVPGVHGGAAVLLPGAQRPRRPPARPRGLRRPHRAPVADEEAAAAPGTDEDKPVHLGLLMVVIRAVGIPQAAQYSFVTSSGLHAVVAGSISKLKCLVKYNT